MRSAASIKGHPIHPALIPFPFAFLLGAFVFDVLGAALDRPALWTTGRHLIVAGIITALIAAVPGLIDYVRSVPPKSSAKKRATIHMLLNLAAVAAFAVSLASRDDPVGPEGVAWVLEGLGALMLVVSGWLGGTLVERNQIGVDHRYAGAGKGKEATLDGVGDGSLVVASTDELGVDQMKLLHVNGHRIVLARGRDGYVAFADHCTHRGASLADGVMICGTVQCPWHGSQFDVRSGTVRAGPAGEGIETYRVREEAGRVLLEL